MKTPFLKINSKILSLLDRINEIEGYDTKNDFDTREGYIVANIKVYEWLDNTDIETIITGLNLHHFKNEILQEFNEKRLENIYNHVCEVEIQQVKDELEKRVHLNDYRAQARAYELWKSRDKRRKPLKEYSFYEKHYKKEFKKFFKRKNNSRQAYFKYLYKLNKAEIDESDRLDSFTPEVWQWGRSGGWLSVCKSNELENSNFDYWLRIDSSMSNHEINRYLRDELNISKKELISDMNNFISEWQTKFENIKFFVNQIEERKKYFKSCLTDQLEHEINEFSGEFERLTPNTSITLLDNTISTSLGVKVAANAFIEAYKSLYNQFIELQTKETGNTFAIKKKVDRYFVEFAKKVDNDILIKAGCHWFSFNNIQSTLSLQTH